MVAAAGRGAKRRLSVKGRLPTWVRSGHGPAPAAPEHSPCGAHAQSAAGLPPHPLMNVPARSSRRVSRISSSVFITKGP
jgi:hypothetical protein